MTSRTRAAARPSWSLLRVGAALAGLAGGVVLAAPPAHAEPGQVDLRISDDLATDNVPREATLRVTRTDDDCVRVQTLMTVQLSGLERDEIEIAVNENDVWVPLNTVQLTDDAVASVPVVPANAQLCENQRIQVRYRVTFFRTAPDGRVAFIGEAFSAAGNRLDRASEIRQVLQGTGNARENDDEQDEQDDNAGTVDEEDTVAPEPSPDDEETAETGTPAEDDTDAPATGTADQAAGVDLTTAEGQTTFFNGLGPLIIVVGVGMTAIGGALLVTVMRRTRSDDGTDAEDDDGFGPPSRGRGRRGGPGGLLAPTLRR
ncbi:hypothetical protein [Catenuloplanes atrovinosus]|uniref:Uncharacterized protein n=1 Tax=Catenuloplanes atrovinosus TaxID=137266 RepID=A0AAE3YLQ4_9ACTN|nr:hypothetical protein [Catenuloplanes atrovinosus]MDR7274750.1 hypothetical protein [Catenuloplanes atrovinosus]